MTPLRRFRFAFPWRSRQQISRDVDSELAFHLEMRVNELVAGGLGRAAAEARAREEFGDVEFTRRYCRTMDQRSDRSARVTDRAAEWRQDVRYALRMLSHHPAFSVAAVLTLALAVGANTAIFSVAQAVLLKPLPYGNPAALVSLSEHRSHAPAGHIQLSVPDLADYTAQQRSFTGVAAYDAYLSTIKPSHGDPTIVTAVEATANLFDVFEVPAWRGRTFHAGDDPAAAQQQVVLAYDFWRRDFGADPSVVGSTIVVGNTPHVVAGIMPPGFTISGRESIWLVADMRQDLANAAVTRKQHIMTTVARLRAGVTPAAADADLAAISARLAAQYPDVDGDYLATVEPLHQAFASRYERPIGLLFAATALILLIACVNLANLTMARSIARRGELAVRAALGAGRFRIARQLLTEALVLSLLGGALGALIAAVASRALLALNRDMLSPVFRVGFDGRVLAFALTVSVVAGAAFAVVPALSAARADLHSAVRSQGRSDTGGESAGRVRRTLITAQVALAAILLVGAGLLIRSFAATLRVQPGLSTDHVLSAQVRIDGPRYDSATVINAFYSRVLDEIRQAPGVEAAGAVMVLPFQGYGMSNTTMTAPDMALDPNSLPDVGYRMMRGDAFKVLRIPVLEGRVFNDDDRADGPSVAVLDETAAKLYFPGQGAVGKQVHIGPDPAAPPQTVIGVVGDVHDYRLDQAPVPMIYDDGPQNAWWRTFSIVVRTRGDPASAAATVRRAVHDADPEAALRNVTPLDAVMAESLAPGRFVLAVTGSFAALALLLAAVGIYGTLAFLVNSRQREFGVRLALGATGRNVVMLVLRQGLAWTVVGLVLGLGMAALGGRLLSGLLFGVTPLDPVTYLMVLGAVASVALAACLVPAWRAMGVDPVVSMRGE